MTGITEGGNILDKYRIDGGSSGVIVSFTGRKIFLRGANTAMKMNGALAGDLSTGRRKLKARQWAELIGFCGVETKKQVQNYLEANRKGL